MAPAVRVPVQLDAPPVAPAPGRGAAYDRALRDVADAWRAVARPGAG